MDMREPLIFTPMQIEAAAVRRALGSMQPATISVIGIGAGQGLEQLSQGKFRSVILAGFAGALNPDLHIGDVLIETPPELNCKLPYRTGRFVTVSKLVSTPAQKAELFRQSGADAVEMEQAIVRRATDAARLPLISIRAITDTADEFLDPRVLEMVDDVGQPRAGRVASSLLKDPSFAAQLWHLRSATRRASEALGQAVINVIRAIEGSPARHEQLTTK